MPTNPYLSTVSKDDAMASEAIQQDAATEIVKLFPLRVRRIELKDFRQFDDFAINFPIEGPTVLIGVNGAGKSTILDAVSIGLSWLAKRLESPSARGRYPVVEDVKNSKTQAFVSIEASFGQHSARWRLSKSMKGFTLDYVTDVDSLNRIARPWRTANSDRASISALPLLCHYGVGRSVVDIPKRVGALKNGSRFEIYRDSLNGLKLDFRSFFRWFRDREDIENEFARRHIEYHTDPQLDMVRQAISSVVPGFSEPYIVRVGNKMMIKDSSGAEVAINQMSDGERTLFTLVADLARRAAISLEDSELDIKLENAFGVVIIDEIELHLHPDWQLKIVQRLQDAFPGIQFICSTHSPTVLSNVPDSNSFALNGRKVTSPRTYGRTANALLVQAFGTEVSNTSIAEKIDELYAHIAAHRITEAKALLNELKEKVSEDERLVEAEMALWIPES